MDRLSSCPRAGVAYRNADRYGILRIHLFAVDGSLAVFEGGVAQTMAEAEEWSDLTAVVPTITDENALFVLNIFAVTGIGIQRNSCVILELDREGEG